MRAPLLRWVCLRWVCLRWACLLWACLLLTACVDVRSYAGSWTGNIVAEEAIRIGFAPDTRADALEIESIDLHQIKAQLTTSDATFRQSTLRPLGKAASDELASLTFESAPLRSYLLYAPISAAPEGRFATVILSLFSDDHLELRVMYTEELSGVFHLERSN